MSRAISTKARSSTRMSSASATAIRRKTFRARAATSNAACWRAPCATTSRTASSSTAARPWCSWIDASRQLWPRPNLFDREARGERANDGLRQFDAGKPPFGSLEVQVDRGVAFRIRLFADADAEQHRLDEIEPPEQRQPVSGVQIGQCRQARKGRQSL